MDNLNIFEKEKEINESYNKANEIKKILENNELELIHKIDAIKLEMSKLQTDKAMICSEIVSLNEKIESSKSETSGNKESKISFEEIKINCANILNTFIREISSGNIAKANLRFKVKYGKMNLERLIEDENMDFYKLKLETKVQFDKNENDFFFTDENGNIYLDNLNIRKALFPLESVVIENYVPTIYVIDRKTNLTEYKELNNKAANSISSNSEDIKNRVPFIRRLIKSLIDMVWKIFNLIVFLLFISCWISSCINYRYIQDYNNFVKAFVPGSIISSYLLFKNANEISFMENWSSNIAKALQLPLRDQLTDEYVYNPLLQNSFNRFNKYFMNIRLIQKRADSCNLRERINTICESILETSDYSRGGILYKYDDRSGSKKILGSKLYYDNSGYYEDFNTNIPYIFYENVDKLRRINWIDDKTISLITLINFYNINHDLVLIMRVLHEKIESDFVPKSDYMLVDITPRFDLALVFSIIFSFFNLVALFLVLKKKVDNNKIKRNKTEISFFKKITLFLETNFKRPDIFETLSIVNFIFYYAIIILRFKFYSQVTSIPISTTEFTDLFDFAEEYERISSLQSAVIFIFMFNVINHVASISNRFKLISITLIQYIGNILSTFILILYFVLGSFFCGYYLVGDYSSSSYKNITFIFVNTLSIIFKGSFERIDYDLSSNRYEIQTSGFMNFINLAETPFYSLMYKIGTSNYLIFSLVFYFVVNLSIKAYHSSLFLVRYRYVLEDSSKKNSSIINNTN